MEEITQLAEKLNTELVAYNNKPTKACSLRIRKLLGEIKKSTPVIRAKLVELDTVGY